MLGSRSSSRGGRAACSSSTESDDYTRRVLGVGPRSASRRPSVDGVFSKPGRHAAGVKRWDGNRRTTIDWDGLRRVRGYASSMILTAPSTSANIRPMQDPELWFPDGDCLVHLYGRGRSRRGPSFRLPMAQLASSEVFMSYVSQLAADSPCSSEGGGYYGNPSSVQTHELYVPAPARLSPADAFRYHITTRNVFAGIFGRPIVGVHLGQALIDLLERMNTFNPTEDDNLRDILAYMEDEGYGDFRECPDHALAVLNFAEHFESKGLWTDAFVHCAGMNNRLIESGEFEVRPLAALGPHP